MMNLDRNKKWLKKTKINGLPPFIAGLGGCIGLKF